MKKLALLLTVIISTSLYAQDFVNIMYYNLLNYPSSSPLRHDTLRKIVQYVKPDLFLVNELQSNAGANLILANSLNQFGITYYQKAAFIDGPDTDNMLFYNSTKFGLVSQKKIATVLRDVNEYVMYYKDPNITALSDTIYFYMYSLHLKAGNTDEFQRNIECTTLRNYLDAKSIIENVFVGGDFNFYTSSESGFSTLKTSANLPLIDPIYASGNWHNSNSYAYLHTQSTRTYDLGDGAWGGMDDRFDFIFTTNDVMTGSKGIKYIENSYQALGQDGLRFNGSIINPTNNLVPDSVSQALYYMSDHLPVILEVEVNYLTNSIAEPYSNNLEITHQSKFNRLKLNQKIKNGRFTLYSLTGKKIMDVTIENTKLIHLTTLEPGIYIWRMETNGTTLSNTVLLN